MNEKYPYDYNHFVGQSSTYSGDYLLHKDQEIKTSQNLETIERLFDEWDDEDKSTSETFSLDNQNFDNKALSYEPNLEKEVNYDTPTTSYKSGSSYAETPNDVKYDTADPLEQTKEIDSVDLAQLKALQAKLHEIYDEPETEQLDEAASQTQSKGKALTKATKQGIAFSNGSLTRTFLDCVVLCFVTASMGFVFLMNIISHI